MRFNSFSQEFPNPPRFSSVSEYYHAGKELAEMEKDLLHTENYTDVARELDRLRTQWACITAKSQRAKKHGENEIHYVIKKYDQLTEVKPFYPQVNPVKPPSRDGEVIQKFTERSRQRMMRKARTLNKNSVKKKVPINWTFEKCEPGKDFYVKQYRPGKLKRMQRRTVEYKLPVPFFVTLTYHENYKDCRTSKKHLNTFLERWRKRCPEFAYFWKMEPQERGAIHYHLAMFVPEKLQRLLRLKHWRHLKWHKNLKYSCLGALRLQIQNDWAEITAAVDGYDVPFTRIDYIRWRKARPENDHKSFKTEDFSVKGNTRQVKTRCANPRVEYKIEPDIEHRFYGTNVRVCDNWKQFLGYVYKYMGEELEEKPFGDTETGRFWGFSTNLDFEALQSTMVDHSDLERLNTFCNNLNNITYRQFLEHMRENKKRKIEQFGRSGTNEPHKLDAALAKIENSIKAQMRRYTINKEKIKAGYMLQFEINHVYAAAEIEKLAPDPVKEFFANQTYKHLIKTNSLNMPATIN